MSRDPKNEARWWATRKVDGEIEYLVSHSTWNPDKRFAKVFDTKSKGSKYMREVGFKGTVRRY